MKKIPCLEVVRAPHVYGGAVCAVFHRSRDSVAVRYVF